MRIAIVANYFYPETVGAGIWVHQLALDFVRMGHPVTVVTSFPSYPRGRILAPYSNRFVAHEVTDGIDVIRTLTCATQSKSFWARLASFGTFCLSAAVGYVFKRRRADVVYAILPPLPLGVSAWVIAKLSGARLVVNVQDIYPDIAVELNYLKNRAAIAFFRRMERWIYARAERIVVISDGFRQNLVAKGVDERKIEVIPNWADPEEILPGPKENSFRSETGANSGLLVVYSGGLTHNSDLEPVLEAAAELRGSPIRFAIVGEGVQKQLLVDKARAARLDNIKFFPFQPIDRYSEVLAAADITLVTLNSAATFASVPSKVYKQMAAARPIFAITNSGNELTRLLGEARCGVAVPPGNAQALAVVLRQALNQSEALRQMGERGRAYLVRNCSRRGCVGRIEAVLTEACAAAPGYSAAVNVG